MSWSRQIHWAAPARNKFSVILSYFCGELSLLTQFFPLIRKQIEDTQLSLNIRKQWIIFFSVSVSFMPPFGHLASLPSGCPRSTICISLLSHSTSVLIWTVPRLTVVPQRPKILLFNRIHPSQCNWGFQQHPPHLLQCTYMNLGSGFK